MRCTALGQGILRLDEQLLGRGISHVLLFIVEICLAQTIARAAPSSNYLKTICITFNREGVHLIVLEERVVVPFPLLAFDECSLLTATHHRIVIHFGTKS